MGGGGGGGVMAAGKGFMGPVKGLMGVDLCVCFCLNFLKKTFNGLMN